LFFEESHWIDTNKAGMIIIIRDDDFNPFKKGQLLPLLRHYIILLCFLSTFKASDSKHLILGSKNMQQFIIFNLSIFYLFLQMRFMNNCKQPQGKIKKTQGGNRHAGT